MRRYPEIDEAAEHLIDELVSTGRGVRQRRPSLIYVEDWSALDADQRALLVAAGASARAYFVGRRSAAPAEKYRLAAERAARRRANKRRQQVLQPISSYRSAEPWKKIAWREAYAARHFPRRLARILRVAIGVVASFAVAISSAEPPSGRLVVLTGFIAGRITTAGLNDVERMLVERHAQHLMQVFAEARAQTRRIPHAVRARESAMGTHPGLGGCCVIGSRGVLRSREYAEESAASRRS